VAEQERTTYVQSLMPLLAEFDLQPPVSDAHSMVSHVKVRPDVLCFTYFLGVIFHFVAFLDVISICFTDSCAKVAVRAGALRGTSEC
jgi:hypothetical protein